MRTFLGTDLWSSCGRYFSFLHMLFMCVFVFMAIRARRAVYEVVAGRVSLGFSCATHAWFQKTRPPPLLLPGSTFSDPSPPGDRAPPGAASSVSGMW